MLNKKSFLVVLLVSFIAIAAQAASQQWVHLRVDSTKPGRDPEKVKINVPVALMESVLPLVQDEKIENGKLRLNDHDLDVRQLRKIWATLKDQGDTEYMSVETNDSNVHVKKQGNFLLVTTEDKAHSKNQVDIQIPTAVVDAMFSGKDDELNLLGAMQALRDSGVKDIISVKSDDATVHVWIDENNEAK